MKIYQAITFWLLFWSLISSCENPSKSIEESDAPVLKIGKTIDEANNDIAGSSSFRLADKKFSYYLLNHVRFGVATLIFRINRIESNGKRILTSTDVNVDPDANVIYNTIPLSSLYIEYGKGKYLMQFLNGNNTIASAEFELN